MEERTRTWGRLVLVAVLAVAVLSTPALGHAGHESHESSGLSIWPFFLVFGTVTAGGSLLAGYTLDVPRQYAVGIAAGGGAMAVVAGSVWLL